MAGPSPSPTRAGVEKKLAGSGRHPHRHLRSRHEGGVEARRDRLRSRPSAARMGLCRLRLLSSARTVSLRRCRAGPIESSGSVAAIASAAGAMAMRIIGRPDALADCVAGSRSVCTRPNNKRCRNALSVRRRQLGFQAHSAAAFCRSASSPSAQLHASLSTQSMEGTDGSHSHGIVRLPHAGFPSPCRRHGRYGHGDLQKTMKRAAIRTWWISWRRFIRAPEGRPPILARLAKPHWMAYHRQGLHRSTRRQGDRRAAFEETAARQPPAFLSRLDAGCVGATSARAHSAASVSLAAHASESAAAFEACTSPAPSVSSFGAKSPGGRQRQRPERAGIGRLTDLFEHGVDRLERLRLGQLGRQGLGAPRPAPGARSGIGALECPAKRASTGGTRYRGARAAAGVEETGRPISEPKQSSAPASKPNDLQIEAAEHAAGGDKMITPDSVILPLYRWLPSSGIERRTRPGIVAIRLHVEKHLLAELVGPGRVLDPGDLAADRVAGAAGDAHFRLARRRPAPIRPVTSSATAADIAATGRTKRPSSRLRDIGFPLKVFLRPEDPPERGLIGHIGPRVPRDSVKAARKDESASAKTRGEARRTQFVLALAYTTPRASDREASSFPQPDRGFDPRAEYCERWESRTSRTLRSGDHRAYLSLDWPTPRTVAEPVAHTLAIGQLLERKAA